MTLPNLSGADAEPTGIQLDLLAVLGYAISGNLLVPLQQRYGGPAVTLWALAVSSVLLLPFGIAGWSDSEFSLGPVLAVVSLGVIGTGVARSLSATLAGRVGAARMSTTTYPLRGIAIALGAIFRDDTVTLLSASSVWRSSSPGR